MMDDEIRKAEDQDETPVDSRNLSLLPAEGHKTKKDRNQGSRPNDRNLMPASRQTGVQRR